MPQFKTLFELYPLTGLTIHTKDMQAIADKITQADKLRTFVTPVSKETCDLLHTYSNKAFTRALSILANLRARELDPETNASIEVRMIVHDKGSKLLISIHDQHELAAPQKTEVPHE